MLGPELERKVASWLEIDQNEDTKAELLRLVADGQLDYVDQVLSKRMEFGTAGLRAKMGPGYSCMNDVTIIQTSQAFAKYILSTQSEFIKNGIVISYDARHNSKRFAELAATAMILNGIKVHLFSSITATPFVPYCVLRYKAVAGIMVTASHNPKDDNGYKVYWSNGAQIISPHDKNIAASILANLAIAPEAWDTGAAAVGEMRTDPLDEIMEHYYIDLKKYCTNESGNSESNVKITYTPMHGVGQRFMVQSFKTFGLPPFISVEEQCEPDPDFSTVTFPNPEEGKSSLDLAMKTAERGESSIIIANDPDADRLACAERQSDGTWTVFTGNQLGAIFGNIAWTNHKSCDLNTPDSKVYMIASTVSSKILSSMAKVEGFNFEETLTGFKWMGNAAISRISEGYKCLFAFEESIGYMYGNNVFDKDGISAGAVLGELVVKCYKEGSTLGEYLEDVYRKYGYHLSMNSYYLCYEPAVVQAMFAKIRSGGYPTHCGQYKISHIRDLTTGYDSNYPDNKARLPVDPSCQMITFTFDNGCVATLRTSGTEPKIKYYTELIGEPGVSVDREAFSKTLSSIVSSLVTELLQPEVNNLTVKPE